MKSAVYCLMVIIMGTAPVYGVSGDYIDIFTYLETRHAPAYETIAEVADTDQNQLIFKNPVKIPVRGQELLVLKKAGGKPVSLFSVKAVIKVNAVYDNTIGAKVIKKVDGSIEAKDPIALPPPPKIGLSTNIEEKQDSLAYNSLLQALLGDHYDVMEISGAEDLQEPDNYALLIHLGQSRKNATIKINSLYTGSTLFSRTHSLSDLSDSLDSGGYETLAQQTAGTTAQRRKPDKQSRDPMAAQFDKAKTIRLPEAFRRVVAAELDGTPPKELVLLNDNGVFAFSLNQGALRLLKAHPFTDHKLIGLHLHAMDATGDGTEEVFATCARKTTYLDAPDTNLRSAALDWQEDGFTVLDDNIGFYLRVIHESSGVPILLGQEKKGPEKYAGPIFEVHWDRENKKFSQGREYEPSSGIYSLYQFTFGCGSPEKALILEPENHVSLYRLPDEHLLDTTDVGFGKYKEIAYPVRLAEKTYRGGFDEAITSREAFAPRRFVFAKEFQNQCFFMDKGRTPEKKVSEKLISLISPKDGLDRIVGLTCASDNLYQSWSSEKIPRDLIDFVFFQQNQKTTLLGLVRDNKGYTLEVLSKQD